MRAPVKLDLIRPASASQFMNGVPTGAAQFPSDFAEVLQARLRSDAQTEAAVAPSCGIVELLQAHIATVEEALAKAEEIGRHRERAVELATGRIADLQAHIATLETALAKAENDRKQSRCEAEISAKRVNELVAELFKVTSELVAMSKRGAQQTALADKLRAELDEHRSRSWWWKHGSG